MLWILIFVDGTACFHLSGCLYCYRFKHINHKILQRGDILLSWPCCAPPWSRAWLDSLWESLWVEALCATLCPANIRKSVVPSPTAISSNVSWTFSNNLSMCLTSLLHRETSQRSPPSRWKKPTHKHSTASIPERKWRCIEKDLLAEAAARLPLSTKWKDICSDAIAASTLSQNQEWGSFYMQSNWAVKKAALMLYSSYTCSMLKSLY